MRPSQSFEIRKRRQAAVLTLVVLAATLTFTVPLWAQTPVPTTPPPSPTTTTPDQTTSSSEQPVSGTQDDSLAGLMQGRICQPGECCPPSTQEKILIGVSALAIAVVCFFLLVRVVERSFIKNDRNAQVGRHFGISLSLLFAVGGLVGMIYLITGCFYASFWWWLGFVGALWLIHLIYTLVVLRES